MVLEASIMMQWVSFSWLIRFKPFSTPSTKTVVARASESSALGLKTDTLTILEMGQPVLGSIICE